MRLLILLNKLNKQIIFFEWCRSLRNCDSSVCQSIMHIGFSVSIVGEISSPHSKPGDLLIICSGSGETGSLKSLAEKAKQSGIDLALVTMKKVNDWSIS